MRIKNILFPVDFSDHSRALDQEVEWLAARFDARVTLLHVFEIPLSWCGACEAAFVNMECLNSFADAAKEELQKYELKLPEARIERIAAEGEPAWQITTWAAEHDCDLIVMGTHGYGKLRGLLLGSVTARVMHHVDCPVWTHTTAVKSVEPEDISISNILCAIEPTEEAVPLLRYCSEVATQFGAPQVHLVYSLPEPETRPNKYFDWELHRYLRETARVDITKYQRQAGTDFPLLITGLSVPKGVAEAARRSNADLILIGRGKAQETFGLLRTHANQIIHDAPCPVLSFSAKQLVRVHQAAPVEDLPHLAIPA